MEQSAEDVSHLFKSFETFLDSAHKEICRDLDLYSLENPDAVEKKLVEFDEELYRFLSLLPIHYPDDFLREQIANLDYFEAKMQEQINDSSRTTLQKLWSIKYFHNKAEREKAEKDENYVPKFYDAYLAPLTIEEDTNFDILFLHGNQSHCLKCWAVYNSKKYGVLPDIWVKDYLLEDIKDIKPRIVHATYETFQAIESYTKRNIPELSIFDLSNRVKESLHTADIGTKRPLIIWAFSMGGLICKLILNDDPQIAENTKSIIWFAVPHAGSDVRDDTLNQMKDLLSGMNRFMNYYSIEDDEFVNFLLDNLKVSQVSLFLISPERHENLARINEQFKAYNKKSLSITEGKPVFFPQTQHSYFVVKPDSSYWEGSEEWTMTNKSHFDITRMMGKDDKSYQAVLKFIRETFN